MPAAPLDTLEKLGETFGLEAPVEKRRMLIIVNPYASTVSDRLKSLVEGLDPAGFGRDC